MGLSVVFNDQGELSGTDGLGYVLLPSDAQAGDLLVLTVMRGSSNDARLSFVSKGDWDPAEKETTWYPELVPLQYDPYVHIYAGMLPPDYTYPDDAQVPITVDSSGFGFLWAGWVLTVYRGVQSITDVATLTSKHPVANPVVLNVGGVMDETQPHEAAHLSLVMLNFGTVGGTIGADTNDPVRWLDAGGGPHGRAAAKHVYFKPETPEPLGPGRFLLSGSESVYGITVVTFDLLPDQQVTRQYPRDTLGLAAAPRLYPPTRTGRVAGGHL